MKHVLIALAFVASSIAVTGIVVAKDEPNDALPPGSVSRAKGLEAWKRIDGVEIVAVADPLPGRAAAFAAEYGIPRSYTDAAAMLEREGIAVTEQERKSIEIADFGLSDLERTGLEIVVYVNTDRYCAKELILSARPFSAAEGLQWGIVNRICEPAKLVGEALETAAAIAANGPVAVRQAKKSIHYGLGMDLLSGYRFEIEAYNRLVDTDDRREGVRAFVEKRKPDFKGK